MSQPTFEERCLLAEQCLPDAPYRDMLQKLHAEMLEALAVQPAQRQPLTRKKIDEMAEEGSFLGNIYEITRAVEFEHDIKEKA